MSSQNPRTEDNLASSMMRDTKTPSITIKLLIGLAIGVGLTSVAPEEGFLSILDDLGKGLTVAAMITLLWQIQEIREFFVTVSMSVLGQPEYLRRLGFHTLRLLRMEAASASIHKIVENPNYEWMRMVRRFDEILFDEILPSERAGSGIYRERLQDTITLQFMTLEEALREVDEFREGIGEEALRSEVLKQTTITQYHVVAPRSEGYESYEVFTSGKLADMPHFPLQKRVRFQVGTTQADPVEVEVNVSDIQRGGVEFSGEHRLTFRNGRSPVWTSTIEYKEASSESFILETVNQATYGLEARIYATRKRLAFDGNVLGFGGAAQVTYLPNGISLQYPGWFLQDHGYIVWWWEERT